MNKDQQIERAWQLVLGARRDVEHANSVFTEKRAQLERAVQRLKALTGPSEEHVLEDHNVLARIIEVA
jgi:hypothetical protein